MLLDVLDSIVGVLYDVVEEGCANACRSQSNLAAANAGHGDRVHDVRFAGATPYTFVGFAGKLESALDNLDFLAVVAGEVTVQQLPESHVDHQLFIFLRHTGVVIHKQIG